MLGVRGKERGASGELDDDTGSVGTLAPRATEKLCKGLGGKEPHAAIGNMVTGDTELNGTPMPVLHLPTYHAFARNLITLAEPGDLEGACRDDR